MVLQWSLNNGHISNGASDISFVDDPPDPQDMRILLAAIRKARVVQW